MELSRTWLSFSLDNCWIKVSSSKANYLDYCNVTLFKNCLMNIKHPSSLLTPTCDIRIAKEESAVRVEVFHYLTCVKEAQPWHSQDHERKACHNSSLSLPHFFPVNSYLRVSSVRRAVSTSQGMCCLSFHLRFQSQ